MQKLDPDGELGYSAFIYVSFDLHKASGWRRQSKACQFISKWAYEETGDSYKDPHQIAIDSSGNAYLPDKGGAKVLKFDSSGKFITKWGSEGTENSQFKTPHGVAIDTQNNIYVTDMDNFRVQKFDSNGKFVTKWGSESSGGGQFSKVTPGIDVDTHGSVYVIDKDGEDIAIDSKTGNVYVTDTGNSRVQVFSIIK